MWHVSSRSGVATLRTAMHLLLTYTAACRLSLDSVLEQLSNGIVTSPPMGERSIVMSVSVCLCVCLSVRDHIFGTARPIFTKCFVRVTDGLDSVVLLYVRVPLFM